MSKDLGITVKKDENFSEWYVQIVLKTELIDYSPVKGFIVLRPYGYSIWESIRNFLDKRFKDTGHSNGFLPVLIPENLLSKESEHFKGFTPEVFWVTKTGNEDLSENLAVRPTSETLAYSIFSRWVSSYRDLPLKMNFWNSALRAEIKSTKPLIRNSEFLWQEGHTVHATEKEAKEEVMQILQIYRELIEEYLAVPTIAGYKSEKEKFVGAVFTTTLESLMGDGRVLQMATSHNLGQNFAIPFDLKYLGIDNKTYHCWQTSWGVSWRLIGSIIMTHADNKGLILPPKIAPIQVIIVPILKGKGSDVIKNECNNLKDRLSRLGIRAEMDNRDEYTAGWKFNEWELRGVPLRLSLGMRDLEKKQVELVRRDNKIKTFINVENLEEEISKVLDDIQVNLYAAAKTFLNKNINIPNNFEEFRKILEQKGGFLYCGWCGSPECETDIKEKTGADIRVIPFVQETRSICINCKRNTEKTVYFGKAY